MMPVHPGRILKRELTARSLSANRLALELKVPSGRITDILNGKRGISPETTLWLALHSSFGPDACRQIKHLSATLQYVFLGPRIVGVGP